MKQKTNVIIYVTLPALVVADYHQNRVINDWIKIGKTSRQPNLSAWDSALGRLKQVAKTGMAVPYQLVEVFEYPSWVSGNADGKIRDLLIQTFQNVVSSSISKGLLNGNTIAPGKEFVKITTKEQIHAAIKLFEHELLMKCNNCDQFKELLDCIKRNWQQDAFEDSMTKTDNKGKMQNDKLWAEVISLASVTVRDFIKHPQGRPYASVGIGGKSLFFINAYYSVRYHLASVSIETYGGLAGCEQLQKLIENTNTQSIEPLYKKQGTRNPKRWAWIASKNFEENDPALAPWLAEKLQQFYLLFGA